jgi:hypothetical protein
MNERLNKYLDENNIMSNCQIGFRKNYRTADHLLVLKTLIDYYKSKRKPIFACFIDFKKAYNSVWREGLFFKLILNAWLQQEIHTFNVKYVFLLWLFGKIGRGVYNFL